MDTRTLTQIQEKTEDLLTRLGVKAKVLVEVDQSEVVKVNISPPSPNDSLGALIGFRGDTLRSLQLILSLIVNKGREERIHILVDVDGYRLEREESLKDLARKTIEKVRYLHEPISLPSMSAYERRIIHLEIAGQDGVVTESMGEGRERRVVVKPAE